MLNVNWSIKNYFICLPHSGVYERIAVSSVETRTSKEDWSKRKKNTAMDKRYPKKTSIFTHAQSCCYNTSKNIWSVLLNTMWKSFFSLMDVLIRKGACSISFTLLHEQLQFHEATKQLEMMLRWKTSNFIYGFSLLCLLFKFCSKFRLLIIVAAVSANPT